jgi:hypothetical protein
MSRMIVATGVVLLLSGLFSSAQAQSLGDTARQEEERRQGVKAPSKVITNKDLRPAPQPSSPPPPAGGTTAAEPSKTSTSADGNATKDAKSGAKDDAKDATKADVKDQKYWRDRMKKLQDQLQRDRVYAEALQSRINALTTDFVNRDDPAQRGVVATNRQQAVDELDRLKKSIAETTKAIPALEEEARQANVPAGWLR